MKVCYCIIGGYRPRRFDIHSGEDIDVLLGCNIVWDRRYVPTLRRNILPTLSGLKIETVCFWKRWYLPTGPRGLTTQNNDIYRLSYHNWHANSDFAYNKITIPKLF
jgi:hypothetical protein